MVVSCNVIKINIFIKLNVTVIYNSYSLLTINKKLNS